MTDTSRETAGQPDVQPRFRSLLYRVLVLTGVVMVCAQVAVALWAARVLEADLVEQAHLKAEVVGRQVAVRIEEALALGIPLEKLVGVEPFLAEVLVTHPELAFLWVSDPSGSPLFQAKGESIGVEIADGHASFGGHVAVLPLSSDRIAVGMLSVGEKPEAAGRFGLLDKPSTVVLWPTLLSVLVFLVTAELLVFNFVGRHAAAWGWLRDVLRRIGAGDFRSRPALFGHSPFSIVGDYIARFVAKINDDYLHLQEEAEEIKAGQPDRALIDRIDGVVESVRSRFVFGEPGEEERVRPLGPTRLRLPLFFLMVAVLLPMAVAPPTPGALDTSEVLAGFDPVGERPALLFMTAAFFLLLGRITIPAGASSGRMLAAGGLAVLAASVLADPANSVGEVALLAGLAGFGLACAVGASAVYAAKTNAGFGSADGSGTALKAAAAAAAVALPTGHLLSGVGEAAIAHWLSVIAAFLGTVLTPIVVPGHSPAQLAFAHRSIVSMEPVADAAHVILINLLFVVPLSAVFGALFLVVLPFLAQQTMEPGCALPAETLPWLLMLAPLAALAVGRWTRRWAMARGAGAWLMASAGMAGGLAYAAVGTLPTGDAGAWALVMLVLGGALGLAARGFHLVFALRLPSGEPHATLSSAGALLPGPAILVGLSLGVLVAPLAIVDLGLAHALMAAGGVIVLCSTVAGGIALATPTAPPRAPHPSS